MQRRQFLIGLGAAAVAAPMLSKVAHGKRGSDDPKAGSKKEVATESNLTVKLPAWTHGASSTATNAMLMFRGNPSHTFYGTGPIPTTKPKILWKHRMIDFPSLYYGEPFVWRGTGWTGQAMVYGGYVWVGSQGKSLYCFEAATGKVAWRHEFSRQIKGSGCLWDGKIYIGCVDDWLRCLDAATGAVIWKLNSGYDLDSSPSIVDGKLYIAGENGNARCLDPLTGKKIWKTFVGGIDRGKKTGSYGSETSPAVVDGEYYTATYDGELFCLDAATGEKRWVAKTGDDTDGSPVVAGELVYVAAEDKSPYVYAFRRKDGSEVWKHKGKGGYWATPAVVGDVLYIGSAGGKLDALDRKTGAVKWTYQLGIGTWGSAAVVDGKVLVGDMEGTFHCVDAASGKGLWTMKLGGRLHSSPAVIDGKIYIGSTDGFFHCIG